MKITMTCLRKTAANVHGLDMSSQGTLLLDWHKCKRNIAYDMFLVGHSSMGECTLAECALAKSSFPNSRIDSLKPVSIAFDKYKARLVARGFLQKLGVDFFSDL